MVIRILAILLLALPAYGAPTPDEFALLALSNGARAEVGQPPLVWSDELYNAAKFHSDDMAKNGCFGHSSCNGEAWDKRVGKFYKNWNYIGENVIGVADDPRTVHAGFMSSSGHKANIISGFFTEFGDAFSLGVDGFGPVHYATENFGTRGFRSLNTLPTIPAAGVMPVHGGDPKDLVVNYFDVDSPPVAIRAIVGNKCINLPLIKGSAKNGMYGVTQALHLSGCTKVVFEVVRDDGIHVRWPMGQAINVGEGCSDWVVDPLTQTCGDDPPLPTPSPIATPVSGSVGQITKLKIGRTTKITAVSGEVIIPIGTQLINDVSLSINGQETSIPASCIVKYGKGVRSKCGAGSFTLVPSKKTYRFRFEVTGVVQGMQIVLKAAGLQWTGG